MRKQAESPKGKQRVANVDVKPKLLPRRSLHYLRTKKKNRELEKLKKRNGVAVLSTTVHGKFSLSDMENIINGTLFTKTKNFSFP